MQLVNDTPFSAEQTVVLSRDGAETLLVVVKGTWVFDKNTLAWAELQEPIHQTPEYWDDPVQTSLIHETDLFPPKNGTDFLITGSLELKEPVPYADIQFRLAGLTGKLRVYGDRTWERQGTKFIPSEPAPFRTMPLVFERAYGGSDRDSSGRDVFCEQNPVGCGFFAQGSQKPIEGSPLPNLENPQTPIQSPFDPVGPVCWAPVSPSWMPRRGFAGTYDVEWEQNVAPLLPNDFDTRFYSAAAAGCYHEPPLQGGEEFELDIYGHTKWSCSLPKNRPSLIVKFNHQQEKVDLQLDTVRFSLDGEYLTLLWKGETSLHHRINQWQKTWLQLEEGQ